MFPHMGCLTEDRVLARVQGELHEDARAEVDAHLDTCEGCRRLVAAVAAVELPSLLDGDPTALSPRQGGDLPPSGLLKPGTRVGRYVIEEPLGGGAMGMVYAGRHETLGRAVALKVARASARAEGLQLRARLLREARAASAIRHRHVVTVHDVLATDDGQPVIVMDRLEGRTLRARLAAEGQLTPNEAVRLMDQVLAALEAAHEAGVVHRDLKPDNVFLVEGSDGEEVRLVDFGIAKLTAVSGPTAQSAGLTVTGMLVGTPHYMAPEQAFAEPVDPRTDLWAVGVMLYECVSGQRPVRGDQVGQLLRRLARLDLVPLERAAPGCPRDLRELIGRLLVERDQRPHNATSVRAELAALVTRRAQPQSQVSIRPLSEVEASGVADTLDAHEASSRRAPAWRPLALGGAIFLLLGVGLVAPRLRQVPATSLAPGLTLSIPPAPSETRPSVASAISTATSTPPTPAAKLASTAPSGMKAPPIGPPPVVQPVPSSVPQAAPRPGRVIVDPPF